MSYTAARLVAIAEAEVGYLEKASNYQLDSKTANAGSGNWTKYARDLYAAGYYNGNKNGFAWCDVFVDWCFYQLCNKNAKKAQEIICQTGDCGAGCSFSMSYYKNANRFYYSPCVGDQIFFKSGNTISHTGIVYAVDSTRVYTIEGNTSGASGVVANGGGVFKKSYLRTSSYIAGYGRPRYDASNTTTSTSTTTGAVTNNTTNNNTTRPSNTSSSPTVNPVVIVKEDFIKLSITSISTTNVVLSIKHSSSASCKWKYTLTNVNTGAVKSGTLSVANNTTSLTSLIPNSLYSLKVTATVSSKTIERQITFVTPQELPGRVLSPSFTFGSGDLLDRTCRLSFKVSNTVWGEYNSSSSRSKGYRVSFLINGQIVAFSDTLIGYSGTTATITKTFALKDLVNISKLDIQYNDIIQVGVQTWVKDASGNKLLNEHGPVCSTPVYLKHFLKTADKLFIKTSGSFQRALLYVAQYLND